ncbi:hypothetical protein LQZ24_03550 [Fructobacillus sp. M1-13]|uniref:Preprotein translocase subunit SecE n=1 Tax=Fructobacillus papyriferae TaxID=2713171 RepID=A0ABS5QPX4_9LACO|nr:hypothetical protein [Fructobacillus papyriferae]MBS9335228.1 hypothetical protein [Fructobacillus papyriferae]MCD2159103.1 hypothetical protein [Fructobacillus papyriferae]
MAEETNDTEKKNQAAQPVEEKDAPDRLTQAKEDVQKGALSAVDSAKTAYGKVKGRTEWSNPVVVVVAVIVFLVLIRLLFGSLFNAVFNYLGELLMAIMTKSAWPVVFAAFIIYYRKEIRDLLNRIGR